MGITTNAPAVALRFQHKVQAYEPALRRAAVQGSRVLLKASLEAMEAGIYAVPVRQGKSGQPLWVRRHWEGGLISQEACPVDGVNFRLVNLAPHAKRRHYYGLPGGDPATPPQHAAPWQQQAVSRTRKTILTIRRRALADTLRTR